MKKTHFTKTHQKTKIINILSYSGREWKQYWCHKGEKGREEPARVSLPSQLDSTLHNFSGDGYLGYTTVAVSKQDFQTSKVKYLLLPCYGTDIFSAI
jgi:hypothetical protein